MAVHSAQIRVATAGHGDVTDITRGVQEVVDTAEAKTGLVNVFVAHSTAAVTLIENEPGGVRDIKAVMDRLVPPGDDYEHNRTAADTNAHAHMQAAIIGPSETVPLKDGQLQVGTWQQFVLIDFDDRPRERRVMVAVLS